MGQPPLRLPNELLWKIFDDLWNSNLNSKERITLMTASLQVSKTWTHIFARIAYKDAHIPCPSYLDAYLRIMRQESPLHRALELRALPHTICRSITIEMQPTVTVLPELLYKMKAMGTHPNVRTLILRYSGCSDEILDAYQFIDLPDRITDLELHLASVVPDTTHDGAGHCRDQPWYLPQLRRLSVYGAKGHEDIVNTCRLSCPQLEILETDSAMVTSKHSMDNHDVHTFRHEVVKYID